VEEVYYVGYDIDARKTGKQDQTIAIEAECGREPKWITKEMQLNAGKTQVGCK